MTCRRAFDADLAAVLRGDAGDTDFLAHYPSCPDCAAEVQVWRELDGMLRAGAPGDAAHPDPEVLLAFADGPTALADAVRSDIERHLAACRVCTDEVRTLARFDPATLAAVAAAVPPPGTAVSTPDPPNDVSPVGGWFGRVVWHPAFAYALVAVLLLPLLRDQLGRLPTATRVAEAPREEARQAPEAAMPQRAAAPKPAPAPPPPAESDDRVEGAASLHDLAGSAASRRDRDAPAAAMKESKARAAADINPGDAAPAKRMAPPAQAAPAELARRERQTQPSHAEIEAAAAPDAALESRARGAVVPGAASEPEVAVAHPPAMVGAGGAGGPIIEVRASAPTVIPLAIAEGGVLLRVVPPEDFAVGAVHVRSRATGRAISTGVSDRTDAIEVRIPPRWLATGDYDVTLTSVDDMERTSGTSNTGAILRFSVSAPVPAAAGR